MISTQSKSFFFEQAKRDNIYIYDESEVSTAQGVPRKTTVRSQKCQYKRDMSKYSAKTLVNTQTK
jgi:hypothetical protein